MVGIGDLSRGFIREICESNTGEERPVIQVLKLSIFGFEYLMECSAIIVCVFVRINCYYYYSHVKV
uniref:Bm7760 n=1 Tax=Brugia malayi TaxID=6279 RepID=A0A1I9G8E4_BRUMA|nr:Bm7760 [Brugia malayi]